MALVLFGLYFCKLPNGRSKGFQNSELVGVGTGKVEFGGLLGVRDTHRQWNCGENRRR